MSFDIISLVLEDGEDRAGTGRSPTAEHLLTPVHSLHRDELFLILLSFSWAEVGDLNEIITEISSNGSLYLRNNFHF